MLSDFGPLQLGVIAAIAAVIGALVGKRLVARDARPSRRHVLQAFAIPVLLTLLLIVVWIGRLLPDPVGELKAFILIVAVASSVVIALPYLVAIDLVVHRRVKLQFGLRGLFLAITAICLAAAVLSYVEYQTLVPFLVIVAVWINWIVVATLIVGTLDGRGPTRAGSIGALVPTAVFGFMTMLHGPFQRDERTLTLLVMAYITALFASRVCVWRHRRIVE